MRNAMVWCALGLLAGCFGGGSGGGGGGGGGVAGSASGVWSVTETTQTDTCDGAGGSKSYTITVTQSGSSVTVSTADGQDFHGTLSGNRLGWTGDVSEDGGITRMNVSATLSGSSLSGSTTWSWTDGVDSCNGSTAWNATRISGGPSGGLGGGYGGSGSDTDYGSGGG